MSTLYRVKGKVRIKQLDNEGTILRDIKDKNSETLWAQIAITPTIAVDFITSDWKSTFGLDISRTNKTGYAAAQTSQLRSGLLSTGFTRSGSTYSVKFSWTNSTSASVTIYGLLSYDTSGNHLYTIFDLSSNPLIVAPQNVIIGQYNITYTGTAPSFPTSSTSSSTYQNTNTILCELRDGISPDVRAYKYKRIFLKTSDYFGCDLIDTGIQSSTALTVTSSRSDGKGFSDSITTELMYKFVTGGQLGGARAIRYFYYHPISIPWGTLNGVNHDGATYNFVPPVYCEQSVGFDNFSYKTIQAYKTSRTIKPFKIKFPEANTSFGDTSMQVIIANSATTLARYNHLWYGPFNGNYQQGGFIAYLYWPDSPQFSVCVSQAHYSASDGWYGIVHPTVKLYVNGQEFTSIATTISQFNSVSCGDSSNSATNLIHSKHTFNLSGLSQGSGIVAISVQASASPAHYLLPYMNRGYKLLITGDMYGYAVPYAGMFTPGSGDITNGWISSSFAHVGSSDQALTSSYLPNLDAFSVMGTVQNTKMSNLPQYTDHHLWVWVKESEKDKVAGVIEDGNTGKVPYHCSVYNANTSTEDRTYLVPFYQGPFTFFTMVRSVWEAGSYYYTRWRPNVSMFDPSYSESMVNSAVNPNATFDVDQRSITYVNDKSMELSSAQKGFLARVQGTSTYVIIPWVATTYTEGTATITAADETVWEYETLIQDTEYVKYLTIQFDASSLFVTNEYLSIPVNDNDKRVCVDYLEKWYVSTAVTPSSSADPIKDNVSVGVDELFADDRDNSVRPVQLAGDNETIKIFTPSTSLNISDGRYTHYLTYSITYQPGSGVAVPHIAIPRYIDEGGLRKFVDVSDVYLTDGLHLIPWSLDTFGHDVTDELGLLEHLDYWVIVPNTIVLNQLFADYKQLSIAVFAYLVAKPKTTWLPLTFNIDYTDTTQNLTSDYMTKVTLPFCIDRNIQVTNATTGEPLPFTLLQNFNFPITTDTEVGNHLYIQLPVMNKAKELKQAFMKFWVKNEGTRDANSAMYTYNLLAEVTPFVPTAHTYCIPYDTYSGITTSRSMQNNQYHGGVYLSVNDTKYFEEFDFQLSPDWLACPTTLAVTIATSGTSNVQAPDSFFRLYLKPSTMVSKAIQTYNITPTDYTATEHMFNYTKANAGFAYTVSSSVADPLEFEYYLGNGATSIKTFSVVNATTLSSSTGITTTLASRNNCLYYRRNYSDTYSIGLSAQESYSEASEYYTHSQFTPRAGTSLLFYDNASVMTLTAYKSSAFIKHKFQYLNIATYRPSRIHGTEDVDFYLNKPNELVPLTTLTIEPPLKRMLVTNKTLSPKFGPAVYTVPAAGLPDNFALYTYTIKDVTSLFSYYTSNAGTFILTDSNSASITYDVLISNRLKAPHEIHKQRYKFTVNPDLSALLASGYSFNTSIGFMGNTTNDMVSMGTTCSATPNQTILLMEKGNLSTYFNYTYPMHLFGITERSKTTSQLFSENKKTYFKNLKGISAISDATYLRNIDWSVSTLNGGQCMLGLKQPVFDYQHIHHLYMSRYTPAFETFNLCKVYTLSKTTQTYTSLSSLDEDAYRVDSIVVARSNKKYNVIFDTNLIPIQKIKRFGHFSPHLYTDEYGVENLQIMPVVQIFDSVLEQLTTFVIDKQYYAPVDVTQDVNALTDTNIQKRLFDHYLSNCYTYDHFNKLLDMFDGAQYSAQLGLIIYGATIDKLVIFNGLSVQIVLSDINEYIPIKWCYANEKINVLTNDKSELRPSSSIKVRLYNPNTTDIANFPVKIDISSFTLASFSLGLVFALDGLPLPTAYEVDTEGHLTTDFSVALGTNAWTRVPLFHAKSFIELTVTNITNNYNIDDVFDFYDGFSGSAIDTTKWNTTLTGTSGVSNGKLTIQSGDTSTVNGLSSVQSLSSTLRYEVCYQTTSPNRPSIWDFEMGYGNVVSNRLPSCQNDTIIQRLSSDKQALISNRGNSALIPYWNDTVSCETWFSAPLNQGDNVFYVYYNGLNATDVSDGKHVFPFFEDFALGYLDTNKWHLIDHGISEESQTTWRVGSNYRSTVQSVPFTSPIVAGNNSIYFDGGSATGLYCRNNMSTLAIGSGAFTIDVWVYTKDVGNPALARTIICKSGGSAVWNTASGGISYQLFVGTEGKLYFQWATGATTYATLSSSTAVSISNSWHHIAVVQDATNLNLYLDGVRIAQTSKATVTDVTTGVPEFSIGAQMNNNINTSWNGYMSNLRVSIGNTRWLANFTPPTDYHIVDPDTYLLVYGNELYSTIIDHSTTPKILFQYDASCIIQNVGATNCLLTSRKFYDNDKYAVDVSISSQSGTRNLMLGWTNLWYGYFDASASLRGLRRLEKARNSGVTPQPTPMQASLINTWHPGIQLATTIPGRFSLAVNGVTKLHDKLNNYTFAATEYTRELGRLSIGSLSGWAGTAANYPMSVKSIRVRDWRNDATLITTYGSIEQSSWVIDGITYTKRIPITINSTMNIEAMQHSLDTAMWGTDFNIRITGSGGSSLVTPYIEYDTSCVPVISSLRPFNNSVSYSHQPLRENIWWVERINKTGISIPSPSAGKLALGTRPGQGTDVVDIYWIRARTYADLDVIQVKESDIVIMVEKQPTDWYLFDGAGTSTSDKTFIENCLNTVSSTMVCGNYNKRMWAEFPDQTRYNAGIPGVNGRYLEYRK